VLSRMFLKDAATDKDFALAHDAAQKVVETHHRLARFLRVGMTLAQIDAEVARVLEALGARSCFLKYKVPKTPPFPSHACLSVNDCVVHGTAGYLTRPLRQGDLLKIDIGVLAKGWIGDAAWTYSFGPPTPDVARLMESGKQSLRRGVATLRPGNTWIAWAREVQRCVEGEFGFHLVRGLGGHGYGKRLHAPPFISNVVPTHPGEWPEATNACTPGTLVAVEPMIAMGTSRIRQDERQWPVYSADGSMSVHYEHDVLVTQGDPKVLTHGLEDLPDVVG
jgi:methionyl aminopeptidase